MGLWTCVLLVTHLLLRDGVCQAKDNCLTSPKYPNNYPDNSDTKLSFSVTPGQAIDVTFQDFDVELGDEGCEYDYLEFKDGLGNVVGARLCGNTLPAKITIGTSTASVLFHSDSSVTKKGFKFCYTPDPCKVHIGKSGVNEKPKLVAEGCKCPADINKSNWLGGFMDDYKFRVRQNGPKIVVKRTDGGGGWNMDLSFKCQGFIRSTKGFCELSTKDVLKAFIPSSDSTEDAMNSRNDCEDYCWKDSTCWGCSIQCGNPCQWNAIPKCGFIKAFGGKIQGDVTEKPKQDNCQNGQGLDYDGTWSKTKSGHTCANWDSLSDHEYPRVAHNYCRNPLEKSGFVDYEPGVWCFTTDPNKRWELCDVPVCGIHTLSPKRKYKDVNLSADKLQAEGDLAVQSMYPLTTVFASMNPLDYFEMTCVAAGTYHIGLALKSNQINLAYYPGKPKGSYGYGGGFFDCFKPTNDKCQTAAKFRYNVGDTVGCGVVRETGRIYFTKNGEYLGEVFTVSKNDIAELYPTFFLDSKRRETGGHISVNLGNKPFVFDPKKPRCNTSDWPAITTYRGKNNQVCGYCKAYFEYPDGWSCDRYCKERGRKCSGAWEGESCYAFNFKKTCDHIFHWKQDGMICECKDNGPECNSYTALTDSWRKIDYNNRGIKTAHCDNKMVKKWYRFEGEAGSKLPTEKAPTGIVTVSSMICGTHRTSWMTSSHPTPEDPIVARKVCFEWYNAECEREINIRVRACYNNDKSIYYVYELGPMPSGAGCANGYCALPEEGHQR